MWSFCANFSSLILEEDTSMVTNKFGRRSFGNFNVAVEVCQLKRKGLTTRNSVKKKRGKGEKKENKNTRT
jgi:hypothetical protein